MAIRTTEAAVKLIIEVDDDISLTPFIETANNILERVCLDSGYSEATLELIERWLSAHFYAIRDPRVTREGVKGIEEAFAVSVKSSGFNTTPYGQQALLLDSAGNLADLEARRGKVQIVHIGGCGPKDYGNYGGFE